MRAIDLTGLIFGRLAVIQRDHSVRQGEAAWRCQCECGATSVVRGSALRSGTVKSCGCYRRDIAATPGERKARICHWCGRTEMVNPSYATRPYCSKECYAASMIKADSEKKPRDREARRVSHRRSKVKRTLAKQGLHSIDVGDLTLDQWRAILVAFAGHCAYCGKVPERLTMDHVIPASKGGQHIASNVVPACFSCNQSKGDKLVIPLFVPSGWLLPPSDWDEIWRLLE